MDQDSTMEGLIDRALQAEYELNRARDLANRYEGEEHEPDFPATWQEWWPREEDQQVLVECMRTALEAVLPGVRLEVWKRAINLVDSHRIDFDGDLRQVRNRMRSIDPNKEGSEWE